MEQHAEPIFLRYGGAEKLSNEMDSTELAALAKNILQKAKEKAFYKGRPIIYTDGGRLIAEWPDGRFEILENNE